MGAAWGVGEEEVNGSLFKRGSVFRRPNETFGASLGHHKMWLKKHMKNLKTDAM
jgi:hypothetical protein